MYHKLKQKYEMKLIILILSVLGVALGNEIRFRNNCGYKVWVGLLGNPGKGHPSNGGFALGPQKVKNIICANNWAGRVWGRTGCNSGGVCQTGDCDGRIQCNGVGGTPPVTLVELTLKGEGGRDFYDISLVDGFNLNVSITPLGGFVKTSPSYYECTSASCSADVNAQCPAELAVTSSNGNIGCKSACLSFNTDQYCCRGEYGTPETCQSSVWPVNYPAYFKSRCPDAYSYAFDDATSTFTCQAILNIK